MQIDDIRDPMVRKASETFVRSTGKPLDRWIVGPADEQLLRELLIHRNFLAAPEERPPFDIDLFTIEMALRGLGVRQIKGLVAGERTMIRIAAKMVIEAFAGSCRR